MSDPLHVSEAASIALHTALWLAKQPERFGPGPVICKTFGFSPAHFAKVVQTLVRAGLMETIRGPAGGVRLARSPDTITLLDVYEAIEGPIRLDRCLLDSQRCRVSCCPVGRDLSRLRREFREALSRATLERVAAVTEWGMVGVKPRAEESDCLKMKRRVSGRKHSTKNGEQG